MDPEIQPAQPSTAAQPSKAMFYIGWVVSILPCLMLFLSASMKFIKPAGFAEGLQHMGWTEGPMFILGIVEITCTILYLIPRSSVLGAILLTAYLGGATATHVRVGDPFFIPIVLGIMVWLGLWLREPRLKALLPLRS